MTSTRKKPASTTKAKVDPIDQLKERLLRLEEKTATMLTTESMESALQMHTKIVLTNVQSSIQQVLGYVQSDEHFAQVSARLFKTIGEMFVHVGQSLEPQPQGTPAELKYSITAEPTPYSFKVLLNSDDHPVHPGSVQAWSLDEEHQTWVEEELAEIYRAGIKDALVSFGADAGRVYYCAITAYSDQPLNENTVPVEPTPTVEAPQPAEAKTKVAKKATPKTKRSTTTPRKTTPKKTAPKK